MKRRNLIYYSLLFLAGCATTSNNPTQNNPKINNQPEKIRFAITDVKGAEKLKSDYELLRIALEESLKIKIDFFPVNGYTEAVAALGVNQVDLVLAGPAEYVLIKSRTNAVPIISISRPNYKSLIVVSATSNIKSIAQLKGKIIAMKEVGSTGGHLGPTKLLIDGGLNPKTDIKIEMLGEEGSGPALIKGKVQAWGGSYTDYQDFLKAQKVTEKDYIILAEGPLLPGDIFMANSQLDAKFVENIRTQMLANKDKITQALAAKKSKFKNSKLVEANDTNYNLIRDVFKVIGEDNI